MHYDGPTSVLTQPGYQKQAQITYTSVASSIEQYVALNCDTDGAVAANFQFGFNGQQKDDEVAGKGTLELNPVDLFTIVIRVKQQRPGQGSAANLCYDLKQMYP